MHTNHYDNTVVTEECTNCNDKFELYEPPYDGIMLCKPCRKELIATDLHKIGQTKPDQGNDMHLMCSQVDPRSSAIKNN